MQGEGEQWVKRDWHEKSSSCCKEKLSSWGCVGGSRDSASNQKGGGFVVIFFFFLMRDNFILLWPLSHVELSKIRVYCTADHSKDRFPYWADRGFVKNLKHFKSTTNTPSKNTATLSLTKLAGHYWISHPKRTPNVLFLTYRVRKCVCAGIRDREMTAEILSELWNSKMV